MELVTIVAMFEIMFQYIRQDHTESITNANTGSTVQRYGKDFSTRFTILVILEHFGHRWNGSSF